MPGKQTVFGALNVEDVDLDGVSPMVSTLVVAFVRRAIAEQLNPFEVLPVSQLSFSLPVQVSGGIVKAIVKDVRSEVQEGTLKLYLTYDFSAEKKSRLDHNQTSSNPSQKYFFLSMKRFARFLHSRARLEQCFFRKRT